MINTSYFNLQTNQMNYKNSKPKMQNANYANVQANQINNKGLESKMISTNYANIRNNQINFGSASKVLNSGDKIIKVSNSANEIIRECLSSNNIINIENTFFERFLKEGSLAIKNLMREDNIVYKNNEDEETRTIINIDTKAKILDEHNAYRWDEPSLTLYDSETGNPFVFIYYDSSKSYIEEIDIKDPITEKRGFGGIYFRENGTIDKMEIKTDDLSKDIFYREDGKTVQSILFSSYKEDSRRKHQYKEDGKTIDYIDQDKSTVGFRFFDIVDRTYFRGDGTKETVLKGFNTKTKQYGERIDYEADGETIKAQTPFKEAPKIEDDGRLQIFELPGKDGNYYRIGVDPLTGCPVSCEEV